MLALMLANFVDGHDVGVIELGGGLSLGLEPLHVSGRGQLSGQDHLEGNQPLQLDLPRLVHHAHAAACDLLQQLVFAEVTHCFQGRRAHGRFAGCERGRLTHGNGCGSLPHAVVVGEKHLQGFGQVRMPGQQFLPIRRLAAIDRVQKSRDDLVEILV